ncbi:MAG TPA: hypothetical protein VFA98_06420 [Thermoanaerobaculia bacterium]|nr:hypothetical protein [Thermoanaerobaculia bacterium]
MIEITPRCPHGTGERAKSIVMLVIAGEIVGDTAIVCPYCNKIIFYVEERSESWSRNSVVGAAASSE